MAEKEEKGFKLRVGELTERNDFGRGIVRISARDMKKLNVSEGDIIEIEGKRKTAAVAVRAYPADVGLEVIRMDGLCRRNCGAGIGETVNVTKADSKEAKSVTIAPARKGIIIHMGSNLMKHNLLMRPVMTGDIIIPNPIVQDRRNQGSLFEQFFGVDFGDFLFTPFGDEKFVVVRTEPKGVTRITRSTEIELLPQATKPMEEESIPDVTYEDLGGLHEEIKKVREMIELPLKHPELFERLSIEPPKGILLHGPPGTGKTLLAKAVANESGAKFFVINGPEIMCVDGETKIFTNPKGYVKAKDIFEKGGEVIRDDGIKVIELQEPVKTYSVTLDGKIIKGKITHTTKLKAPSYEVSLSNGTKIIVSHNQPFLVRENNKLAWKKLIELNVGIPVGRLKSMEEPEEGIQWETIEKIDYLGERELYDFTVDNDSFVGPDMLLLHNSKFYGESLTPDESIFTIEDGIASVQSIGDVVSAKTAESVVEFDEGGKIEKGSIKSFIEHPFQEGKKIFEITTSTGRKIRVTDYHSLFALKDGKVADIKTSDISPGDTYLAVPSKLPAVETFREIDILKELADSSELKVRSPQIKDFVKKTGIKKAADILDVTKKYVYDIYGKNVAVPIKDFLRLAKENDISVDYDSVEIVAKQNAGKLPPNLGIDEDMATVIGIFLAEGSYTTKHAIRITTTLDEVKNVVRRFCNKYEIKLTEYQDDLLINSKPLKVVFEKILGIQTGANRKSITPKLMSMPLPLVKAMLRGYFTGGGSVYPPKTVHTIETSTHSKKLANDLMYTLLYFGIVAKCSIKKEKNGNLCYRVLIQSPEGFSEFSKIGFLDKKRNDRISQYLRGKKFDRTQKIPIWPELRELIRKNQGLTSWAKSKTIGKEILRRELIKTDPEKDIYCDVWNVIESEVVWDKVREMKEVPYSGTVYDVSVNPNENFVAGFGGIFAHNSEENLRKVFEQAEKESPSIIFIDELDAIAPKREEVKGEVEKRVVSQLLTLLDGLKARGKIIVIGATNIPNSIDPALRRPGRFDREIEIGVPNKGGRKEILDIHTRGMPLDKKIDLVKIADITHGYVGADIAALTKEAAMHALRRVLPDLREIKEDKPIPQDILKKLVVNRSDFDYALKIVGPSAMREVLIEIPTIKWDDIGGLEFGKSQLKETIEWPLKYPDSFKKLGIKPPRGVLLYGPPGCGKTLMAKAVAHESGANFISVKGPELLSMWVGESEKHVRDVFRRAKQVAPSVIFFDEIDALVHRRGGSPGDDVTERVVSQLLAEVSGLEDLRDVVVIAATNRPDIIDPALLRPGRFDRQILIPTPDEEARLEILKVHTKDMPLAEDVDLKKIASETAGFSGADLEGLVREAGLHAMRKDINAEKVIAKDFSKAMKEIRPSVTEEMNQFYQDILSKRKARTIEEDAAYTG